MASFSLLGSSSVAKVLATSETGYISQNGALAVAGDAITATGSVDVTVLGSLNSDTGNAIDFDGTTLDLQIGTNGSVGSVKLDGISARFTSSIYVSNDGYLYSGDDALDLRETDGAGSITIVNTGTISGKSDAIVTGSGTSTTRITNYGEIAGGAGGIDQLLGDAVIINYGAISGQSYAYDGAADIDTLSNFGSITGGVIVRGGDDIIKNRGTIDFVELGDGNDVFDGRGGDVTGDVSGGAGDDTYIVNSSDISLVELAAEGNDLVKSKVNFALAANFEDLTLIGSNDIRGIGNGSKNVITGNSGDNVLRGQGGADTLNGGAGDDTLRGGKANDKLIGGNGNDTLRGGSGNDKLTGGDGDDRLFGGAGKDTLTGGSDSDVFVFNRAAHSANSANADTITDFELGIDRIDLSDLFAGTLDFIGAAAFSGSGPEVRATTNAGTTTVRVDVDGDGSADMKVILDSVTGVLESDFIL